ncbi:MAG: tryptophan--tRNA ligase [Patescibacteria group bacterium]|nr:tryptophan--tRNA ligase [Patescibacteria group bacterium]
MQKTVFSGIQPSGNLHLGNYLGAIRNWVTLQEEFNSIFCVVDLHAITAPQDPKQLKEKIIEVAKIYLSAGIDPKNSVIFVQSQIPQHTELMWILNTITKTGELYKMTQFKDKSGTSETKENLLSVDAGLLNYPILMAADILLYDTHLVPVGEDQLQHIELTRTLARRFNDRFGETFIVPEPYVLKKGMRIMGLDDPAKKMSKSAQSKYNHIELLDSPDEIREKIKKAVTDSGSTIEYSDEHPAIKNLLNILSLITNTHPEKIARNFEGKGYKEFKEDLAESIIEFLSPFQKKYHETSDAEVLMQLKNGKEKLLPITEKKIKEVKEKVGFI